MFPCRCWDCVINATPAGGLLTLANKVIHKEPVMSWEANVIDLALKLRERPGLAFRAMMEEWGPEELEDALEEIKV